MAREDAKPTLLDAAVKLILEKGYEAMRIDEVCAQAGLTKGALFHHFRNKEDLAMAAAEHFAARAAEISATTQYKVAEDGLGRLLAYVDQRKSMMKGDLTDFTCLFGMMAQETYTTRPKIAAACGEHIVDHARTLERAITAAVQASATALPHEPIDLAIFIQAVVQGAFVVAKARGEPAIAWHCIDHLTQYLILLFGQGKGGRQ